MSCARPASTFMAMRSMRLTANTRSWPQFPIRMRRISQPSGSASRRSCTSLFSQVSARPSSAAILAAACSTAPIASSGTDAITSQSMVVRRGGSSPVSMPAAPPTGSNSTSVWYEKRSPSLERACSTAETSMACSEQLSVKSYSTCERSPSHRLFFRGQGISDLPDALGHRSTSAKRERFGKDFEKRVVWHHLW